MYLLDTNAWIHLLTGRSPELANRLAEHDPTEVRTCAVVVAELLHGARRSARVEENLRLVREMMAPFHCLDFTTRCAEEYGVIRLDLERSGRVIGPLDMLIAATARAHDATLVTHNIDEFCRVAGLRIEDWEG